MLNNDIEQLLKSCKVMIENISEQIKKEEMDKILLKNTLENMRSVLDYLANDILRTLKSNPKNLKLAEKIYFPYGQRENHFIKNVKKNLAPLKECEPKIYDLIENVQPFKSGNNWVVDLCLLTNNAKHNELSKIENQEVTVVDQKGFGRFEAVEGGGSMAMMNCSANGVPLDDVFISGNDVRIVKHSGSAEITSYNRIKFHGKELEVVPFLNHCYVEIKDLVTNIEEFLKITKNHGNHGVSQLD